MSGSHFQMQSKQKEYVEQEKRRKQEQQEKAKDMEKRHHEQMQHAATRKKQIKEMSHRILDERRQRYEEKILRAEQTRKEFEVWDGQWMRPPLFCALGPASRRRKSKPRATHRILGPQRTVERCHRAASTRTQCR